MPDIAPWLKGLPNSTPVQFTALVSYEKFNDFTGGIVPRLSIYIAAVADFYHPDGQLRILDRIYDPVVALANAISVLTGQFLTTHRPGIELKGFNATHDTLKIFFGYPIKILDRRSLEKDFIFGHRA